MIKCNQTFFFLSNSTSLQLLHSLICLSFMLKHKDVEGKKKAGETVVTWASTNTQSEDWVQNTHLHQASTGHWAIWYSGSLCPRLSASVCACVVGRLLGWDRFLAPHTHPDLHPQDSKAVGKINVHFAWLIFSPDTPGRPFSTGLCCRLSADEHFLYFLKGISGLDVTIWPISQTSSKPALNWVAWG